MEYRDVGDDRLDMIDALPADVERILMTAAAPALTTPFAPLEEHVIELARGDGLGSLEEPGRLARLATWLFGVRARRGPLADPRLEALRRAVVVACHRHHLPDAQAADLKNHGFSSDQIRAVEVRAIPA